MSYLKQFKQNPKNIFFGLLLLLFWVILSTLLNHFQVLHRWSNLFYDIETAAISRPINDDIVIVAIDEHSLQTLGKWPWSRAVHARLLNQLTDTGVAAIGIDLLFLEADLFRPKDDWELAEAIRKNGQVVLPVLTETLNGKIKISKPIEEIANYAHLSHTNIRFDTQGVARQIDFQLKLSNTQYLPTMALSLSQQLSQNINNAQHSIPNRGFITFAKSNHQFRQLSYANVLLNANVRHSLKDKIVLLGITATGLGSHIATPVSTDSQLMSGIEFQANALSTILSEKIILPVKWPVYMLLSLTVLMFPMMLHQFLPSGIALLSTLAFATIACLSSLFLLSFLQLWFSPLFIIISLFISSPMSGLRRVRQLALSLFKEQENAKATLNSIGDAVIRTNKQGLVEYMNPAAEKILNCTLSETQFFPLASTYQIIEQGDSTDNTYSYLEELSGIYTIKNRKDENYAVHISTTPVYTKNGLREGTVHALSDLTEINAINKEMAYISSHDALTGLPNQTQFKTLLKRAIKANKQFAVLFIDLDSFKKVIDGMGHDFGDLLLKEVTRRLVDIVESKNTISRWGGDEFTLLLNDIVFSSNAENVAANIKQTLSHSFTIDNQEVFTTPSIGISLFPRDGKNADDLILRADMAMYNVKLNGRNNYCFYSEDLEFQAKENLIMEVELRHALLRNEFVIHYQPQINLESNQLIGIEALIRWQHPTKGLMSPDSFIPLAEETALIIPIGQWIIKNVCQQIKQWQEQQLPLVNVAINLSTVQFLQKNLVSIISKEVKRYNIPANILQVEITESMMIHDIDRVIKILTELKAAGISIAVDDFGTGYSSLEYLKRLPIDKLKIDKSFIDSVLDNLDDASIVQAIIALGHNMNMQIIAEGVESEGQADFLQKQQCDYAQGFFFSKPVPAQRMGEIIAEQQ